MPTLLVADGYAFYMTMFDCREPRHVHVSGGDRRAAAKFRLDPSVELVTAGRYNPRDVGRIERVIEDSLDLLRRRWDEVCGSAMEADG